MTIRKEQQGNVLTVYIEGMLNAQTAPELEMELRASAPQAEELVLDLEKLEYISSAGLRVMLTIYKQLDGRRIEVTGANIAVKEVFRMTGLEKEFHVR